MILGGIGMPSATTTFDLVVMKRKEIALYRLDGAPMS